MITKEEFDQIIRELNREYSSSGESDGKGVIVSISGLDNYSLAQDGSRFIVCYDCLSSKYPYVDKADMKKLLSELFDRELSKTDVK